MKTLLIRLIFEVICFIVLTVNVNKEAGLATTLAIGVLLFNLMIKTLHEFLDAWGKSLDYRINKQRQEKG